MSAASVPIVPLEAKDGTSTPAKTMGTAGLGIVAAITALADFLLFGRTLGIGLVVFLAAVAAAGFATNTVRANRRAVACASGLAIAGLMPLATNPSILSLLFATGGVLVFATLLFAKPGPLVADVGAATRNMLLGCLHRAPLDLCNSLMSAAWRRPTSITATVVVWFMPIALGLVFAWLFVGANPLLASWVSAIDLRAWTRGIADYLDGPRVGFWLIVIMMTWPVIFVREYRRRAARAAKPAAAGQSPSLAQMQIVGKAAILRSLIVFNGIFAVQTLLDGFYLWGGLALPQGMSYAAYAHRGAYSLIVTALLAAAFVVIALRPGSESERSPLIRGLVYLWIAQNVWLVISSILRLDLYVAAYSLTYWRIAGFVWMVLVAAGLALILTRIALGRSNRWLIGANLVSLAVVLYVCAFPNFARIIADYNVAHSAEMGGGGPSLDRNYLESLGRHAIPAADAFIARTGHTDVAQNQFSSRLPLPYWREETAAALRREMQDWRAWNYSDWRLMRYLDANPTPVAPAPAETPG